MIFLLNASLIAQLIVAMWGNFGIDKATNEIRSGELSANAESVCCLVFECW